MMVFVNLGLPFIKRQVHYMPVALTCGAILVSLAKRQYVGDQGFCGKYTQQRLNHLSLMVLRYGSVVEFATYFV